MTDKALYKRLTTSAIALLALASPVPIALAQDTAPETEIVVTAKRSAQSAASYAGAISKLDADALSNVSAVHPAEALNSVAGVNIHRGSGQEHLTAIRSPVLTGGAGAGSFLYLEDGVPLRAAGFSNVNGLFESIIELAGDVEVSKGPGSVLYGSNAVHGLINVQSAAPDIEKAGYVDILAGSEGFIRAKTSLSGPFAGGAVRAGLNIAHDDGFRADSGFDQQKLQLRYDGKAGTWDLQALASYQNLNQETAGFIRGDDAYLGEDLAASNPNPEAYRDGQAARFSIRLDKAAGNEGKITLIPYARWTKLDFLRHFVPGQARETNGHKSLGVLASYANAFDGGTYTLGVDAELTDGYLREFQDGPSVFSFVQGPHYDYDVKSTALSAYAQTDIALSNTVTLDLGVRGDWTRYDYATDLTPGLYGRFQVVPDRQDEYTVLTPKAALNYRFSDQGNAYIRLARGARAPQVSDAYSLQTNQVVGEIKTETLDAIEAGVRNRIGNFNVQADAYVMKKRNFFFRDSSGFNQADGKTRHLGLELSVDGNVTDKLRINGNVNLARHQYDFDLPSANPANDIKSGEDVDTAPRTLATLGATYSLTPQLEAGLEWRHVGKYFTDPGDSQSYPGHDIFVFRGRWNLNYRISFFGRIDNLFDEKYADRADFAFGSERYFPGRRRTVFAGISTKF